MKTTTNKTTSAPTHCAWSCCQKARVEGFTLCAEHLKMERAWGREHHFREAR